MAEAASKTMTGAMKQASNAVGDTSEAMGKLLSPATIKVSKSIKGAAEGMTEFFTRLSESPLETTIREMSALGLETKELNLILAESKLLELEMKSPRERFQIQNEITKEMDEQKSRLLEQKEIQKEINDAGLTGIDLNLAEARAWNTASDTYKGLGVFEIQRLRVIQERLQEESDGFADSQASLREELKIAQEIELLKKHILDLEGETLEIRNTPVDQGETGDLFKDFEEFRQVQEEKFEKYSQEQDMIAMLMEQYPKLAENLGLLTDEEKAKLEVKREQNKEAEREAEEHERFIERQKAIIDTDEEFTLMMAEKHIAYALEQELLAEWIKNNKELAESMGIVTDSQKKQKDTTEALTKSRKKEGMQFLQNIQSATAGNKKFEGAFKAAAIAETTINTYKAMMAAYTAMVGIPFIGPALAVTASAAAGLAGATQIQNIQAAQYGMNEVVDEPTLILAGEAGAEQVSITPLESPNIEGVQGEGASVVVNVSGNVLTSDFVEGELADNIREAVRRGTDFGIG